MAKAGAGLAEPRLSLYQVPAERERLVAMAVRDDHVLLRPMIDGSVKNDMTGLHARREDDAVRFAYPAVVMVADKG